jgi:ribosome maturation factor RimP
MLSPQAVEKLKSLADEVCHREGCMLYDLEFSGNPKNRILRVFIEADGAPVSIDQCANVSRGLSLQLDVEDLIPGGQYELEVSSPGIERPLRLPWHFKKAIGQEVKVVTFDPVEGLKGEVKSLSNELVSADEEAATFRVNEVEARVPYTNIKRAQVIFGYKKNEKKR